MKLRFDHWSYKDFLFKMVKHHTIEIVILIAIPISIMLYFQPSKIVLFDSKSKLFSWKLKENISCIQLVNFANSFFVVAAPSGLPKIIKFSFIQFADIIWRISRTNTTPEMKLKKKSWSRNLFMKVRDSIVLACPIWIFHPSLCVALGSSVTYIFELAKVSRKLEDTERA